MSKKYWHLSPSGKETPPYLGFWICDLPILICGNPFIKTAVHTLISNGQRERGWQVLNVQSNVLWYGFTTKGVIFRDLIFQWWRNAIFQCKNGDSKIAEQSILSVLIESEVTDFFHGVNSRIILKELNCSL